MPPVMHRLVVRGERSRKRACRKECAGQPDCRSGESYNIPRLPPRKRSIIRRTALLPVIGGMITPPLLSMFVIPAAYFLMNRKRWTEPARTGETT